MKNPLSTEAFADWLDKQPKGKLYEYTDPRGCAICQYFDAVGLQYENVDPEYWIDLEGKKHRLPKGWDNIVSNFKSQEFETFGSAAKRARAALLTD